MQIKLLVDAGAMKPGPALSQKLGPLGINLGKVISQVNEATSSFKGMKVPVILDIDTKTKDFNVKVLTPPVAELLKRDLDLKKGSHQPNKIKIANISIEQIIKIAKIKEKDMFVDSLKPAVKTVIGSCVSLGILVESKEPKEILQEIDQGVYDEPINKGSEEASKEKLDKLSADFKEVEKAQEELVKELERKAEEKAAPAAPATPVAEEAEKLEEKEGEK